MARPLRIGVNALYLIPGGVGGTEIYLRNLLAALAQIDSENQYFILVNAETAAGEPAVVPAAANFHRVECGVRAANRPARLLYEQLALPARIAARRLDVLFSPGFTSPLISTAAKVTVIHDMQHKRRPENFGKLELAAWRATVWISARFSRRILTVSESSRRDIVEVYRLDPGQVEVVPHGVEAAFFEPRGKREETGLGEWPYLLSVSTVHQHKNWERWLEAYGKLAAEGWPQHLVIAGLRGTYSAELERRVSEAGLSERVHMTGWVPRRVLVAMLQHADALVYPSTFEGFGMPVLEAMAAGVPAACSEIPPLEEVAGQAAVFFSPYSGESITEAVRRLLRDVELRRRLKEEGRRRAAQFSWERTAHQTLAVLRRVAGDKV